ncbi:CHASE2 domain-containing protein [Altererythrobacter sp.]|uniref:CHASE2 domain-containing protein n=1 Tax=Altererythrobacter sp. TaxID=1872480 RepID=UPI003D08A005
MDSDISESGNFITRGWRNVREAGPQRLVFTAVMVLIAVLIARYSWALPITGDAERGLFDLRSFVFAERVEQDERLLMVAYNEQTLINARKRSPLPRSVLIDALKTIDTMGAKAIGVDILFDQVQDEDAELVEALRNMRTPTAVAYANIATNEYDITYDQQVYLEEFLAALEGSNAFPASIRLSDADGVTRRWPTIEPDLPPVLGRAMLQAAGEGARTLPGYEGSIAYRICGRCEEEEQQAAANPEAERAPVEPLFNELAIDTFTDPDLLAIPEAAALLESSVRGRYVIIGADLVDIDRVPTSLTAYNDEIPPGMAVHAHMIAQMLDGKRMPSLPGLNLWVLAVLMIVTATLTALLEFSNWRIYPLIGIAIAILVGVPFSMQWRGIDTYGVPAAGWIVGWVLAFAAVTAAARASGAVQRNFAQGALGKYLPKEMAREIIDKPGLLSLHGEKKQIYVLFSDLEGFTKMSHAMTPEQVAKVLNRYLEMLSKVVLDHGGVIDKFVGDAVVAFWGAPIARPDDADRAAKAGYAIWQAGEDFRKWVAELDPSLPPVGKTRVGLHFGEAVVGNFGGENRIQYTALGDSMNTAARLEAANKALDSSVMASREFAEKTTLEWWRPMGKVVLRGRARPVELMEPAPDFDEADRMALAEALAMLASHRDQALATLQAILARNEADKALKNLIYRVGNLGDEGAYVLG